MANITKIMVEEVINDTSVYGDDELRALMTKLKNKHSFCEEMFVNPPGVVNPGEERYFIRSPRSAIIGRPLEECQDNPVYDDNGDLTTSYLTIYYPFFSSHFILPVKPGETVWGFHDGTAGPGFWMSRVHEPLHVEDINFTHGDRRQVPVRFPPIKIPTENGELNIERELEPEELVREPNFPNGDNFDLRFSDKKNQSPTEDVSEELESSMRFQRIKSDPDSGDPDKTGSHYERIYNLNHESDRIKYEPVPRFTKRPGDLVLQGSNNATIILGTDRGYSDLDRPFMGEGQASLSNAFPADPIPDGSGAIDIVAGRGRVHEGFDAVKDINPSETEETATRPRVIENIRGNLELDKNPGLAEKASDGPTGHSFDPPEGDPDMIHDASRVYVTMKTNPDEMLGLTYPSVAAPGDASNVATDVEAVEEAASVIIKSDEVRIVARRKEVDVPSDGAPEINGSIKIVKEGVPDSRDGDGRAAIVIQPDGTIMIDGPKVIIGSGAKASDDDNGGGAQLALGLGATEPIVLGDQLKTRLDQMTAQMDEIIELIDQLASDYGAHTHPTPAGPSSPSVEATAFSGTHTTNSTTVKDGIQADSRDKFFLILSKLGKTL